MSKRNIYLLIVIFVIVAAFLWVKNRIPKQDNFAFINYESKNLGVSFDHDPRLIIKENGGKINVEDHYVIEVLSKSKNQTLEQSINASLLSKYNRVECYAKKVDKGYPTHSGYLMAVVTYPSSRNALDENNLPKCNPDYYETNAARIFWMDPNNLNKFIFIAAGQSVIYATGDINWLTFKVLK